MDLLSAFSAGKEAEVSWFMRGTFGLLTLGVLFTTIIPLYVFRNTKRQADKRPSKTVISDTSDMEDLIGKGNEVTMIRTTKVLFSMISLSPRVTTTWKIDPSMAGATIRTLSYTPPIVNYSPKANMGPRQDGIFPLTNCFRHACHIIHNDNLSQAPPLIQRQRLVIIACFLVICTSLIHILEDADVWWQ